MQCQTVESFDKSRLADDFSGLFPPGSSPQLRAAGDCFQSWQKERNNWWCAIVPGLVALFKRPTTRLTFRSLNRDSTHANTLHMVLTARHSQLCLWMNWHYEYFETRSGNNKALSQKIISMQNPLRGESWFIPSVACFEPLSLSHFCPFSVCSLACA